MSGHREVSTARRLERLTRIALCMHEGQVDKQGRPYFEHILAVVAGVSEKAKPVALFHDSVEDGRTTWGYLSTILLTDELAAVHDLTRHSNDTYADYIARITKRCGVSGSLAREVKVADLRHNLGRLTPELEGLRSRYEEALDMLGAGS